MSLTTGVILHAVILLWLCLGAGILEVHGLYEEWRVYVDTFSLLTVGSLFTLSLYRLYKMS